jgi:hypothetical protein
MWITAAFVSGGFFMEWVRADSTNGVLIEIVSAAAYSWHPPNSVEAGYTIIDCKVVIINALPENLTVHSMYESPFNWAVVSVKGTNAQDFAKGISTLHCTPYYPNPGKAFVIPQGRSTNRIRFTVDKTFFDTNDIQICVCGGLVEALQKSKFNYSVTSNVVGVKLRPYGIQ